MLKTTNTITIYDLMYNKYAEKFGKFKIHEIENVSNENQSFVFELGMIWYVMGTIKHFIHFYVEKYRLRNSRDKFKNVLYR